MFLPLMEMPNTTNLASMIKTHITIKYESLTFYFSKNMLLLGICNCDTEGWWFWTMSFTLTCVSSLVTWLNILLDI